MKLLNLGCGPDLRDGFDNLDARTGWHWEDGLPYADGSVDGITVGCTLYALPEERWTAAFSEMARVLRKGGVVRITEGDTANPDSPCFGGQRGTTAGPEERTLTSPSKVRAYLHAAGLDAEPVLAGHTYFIDNRLENGRDYPKVFIMEGIKP